MTLHEFMQLPQATRLAVIYAALHAQLVAMPVPAAFAPATSSAPAGDARPPKYDLRIPRRGGFQWASETELASLGWWREKKLEGAASGGQYADRDRKMAAELERWIGWRAVAPTENWSGTRGDREVIAAQPTRDPELHPWPDRAPARLASPPTSQGGAYADQDYGRGGDEGLPF